ncbi:MAG: hypothetical protein GXP21_03310 [Gammaproteobacteria bacterium]|nr:hypothetical protein [Gammaproteobacteria bacterium]
MEDEKISVVATDSELTMEVVVLSKTIHAIKVLVGEGTHSVTCDLIPTSSGRAYAGSVMGRELVYAKTRDEMQAELGTAKPTTKGGRNFIN